MGKLPVYGDLYNQSKPVKDQGKRDRRKKTGFFFPTFIQTRSIYWVFMRRNCSTVYALIKYLWMFVICMYVYSNFHILSFRVALIAILILIF